MKYKFLLLLSLAANLNAQYTIDSGWINKNPSLRSANELGSNINNIFANNRPNNIYLKSLSYSFEFFIANKFNANLHELGHAKAAEFANDKPLYNYKYDNWWEFIIKNNQVFGNTLVSYSSGNAERIDTVKAGINATTLFAEQNQNLDLIWSIQNRFASTIYILVYNGKFSDIDELKRIWHDRYNNKHIIGSEFLCFGLSQISDIRFYSYLSENGISIRARKNSKNFDIAIESAIYKDNYNCELFFSPNIKINNVKFKPEIAMGLHGVGYNMAIEYKRITIGYRNPNTKTFSGSRELNRELYIQIKL